LYEIKNLKVAETKGKEIEKFSFSRMEYHPYNHRSVCKQHCVKIHFSSPSEIYSLPKEKMIQNYYNTSKPLEPNKFVGTSHVTPQQEATPKAKPSERRNLVCEKGR